MDISSYIQDLLWDYECVIIPGFGGIMCTYRPAMIVMAEHTLYPPSKSLAFNEYLNNNDGLLVNYICRTDGLEYSAASALVETWVKKIKELLSDKEEIYLPKIGKFHRDVEKNLCFIPDISVNYLSSSYGLRPVVAAPVLREKNENTIHVLDSHRASYIMPRPNHRWALAAVIILFLAIGVIADMMYQGVNIRPLDLNAASVLGFMEQWNKQPEIKPEPKASINKEIPMFHTQTELAPIIPSEARSHNLTSVSPQTLADNSIKENRTADLHPPSEELSHGKKYFIIVGSFKTAQNAEAMKQKMLDEYSGSESLDDTSLGLTRIAIYAGRTREEASIKLNQARRIEKAAWLLVK